MLYPIRIDASSNDNSARLIDSILIDPSCLPIPRSSALQPCDYRTPYTTISTSTGDEDDTTTQNRKRKRNPHPHVHARTTPLERTVLQNSSYLAFTLIADMEVLGVSRVNKSARVRLLTKCPGLIERVEDQIRQQLCIILKKEEENIGRVLGSGGTAFCGSVAEGGNGKESKEDWDAPVPSGPNNLIKVRIRLRENGISLTDEFSVDPYHASSNPITIARSLVSDMNLPLEMVNSIAVSIAEQISGLEVEESLESVYCNDDLNVLGGGEGEAFKRLVGTGAGMAEFGKRKVEREIPAAWVMDEKEEKCAISHYLDNLRPKK